MPDAQLQQWLNQTPSTHTPEDIDAWLLQGLQTGCKLLNLETGIVSRIEGDEYIIRQTWSSLGDIFSPGDAFELNNTYCEAVARRNKTVTYIQVGAIPEMRLHPVYVAVQLESYIGCPLLDPQGKVMGTLNFSSHATRSAHFSDIEIETIESMARHISEVLLAHQDKS